MSTNFTYKNQNFFEFETKYKKSFPKNAFIESNIKNQWPINNRPRDLRILKNKEKPIPTPADVLNDYLESNSVHGLQYFGKIDVNVGILGKILWACTILISFVCLSLMVMQFLHRFNENPTNTYIKSFDTPIYEVPFPAVTVCPSTPISMSRRLAVLEQTILPENVSKELALNLLKYGHIITHLHTTKGFEYMDALKTLLDVNKWTVTEFLKTLLTCDEIFESCWWNTERIDCTKSLKVAHTSYGLCCSYNYQLEKYMGSQTKHLKLNPLRTADYGRWSGLKLVVKNEWLTTEEVDAYDFINITSSDGITVLVHHSMDFPELNANFYSLQMDQDLEIAIEPAIYRKPSKLRRRNKNNQVVPLCTAEDENPLEYFPIYRDANCYANCIIKTMLRACGCLPYIYDPIAKFYNIDRCEIERLHCIQGDTKLINIAKDIENFSCSCRSPCTDVYYSGYANAISLANNRFSKNKSNGTTILRVFMNYQTFEELETLSAADTTYLLASIGGIFSLFLGCSFLSLVEIVYFFYLYCRAIYSSDRDRVRREKGRRTRVP